MVSKTHVDDRTNRPVFIRSNACRGGSLVLALVISLFLGCHASDARYRRVPIVKPGDQELSIRSDRRMRTYLLHLPSTYDRSKPLPVIIALHGGGGNADGMRDMSQLNVRADREGFAVVYPNGTGAKFIGRRFLTWNAGDCCGEALESQADDVGFIRSILENLQKSLNLDPARVYATGFSNGGGMAYRLACTLSDRIAAIAVVSADFNFLPCRPSRAVPVLIFHGTADEYVPYHGGVGPKAHNVNPKKPVSSTVSFWMKHNKTTVSPQRDEFGSIVMETYGNGVNGAEVVLYTIKGGNHAWPGGTKGGWEAGPEPTREISATEIMWRFFQQHPKT